ncbi:hypothetical protein FHS99_003370 [Sphingomonas prati]|uniref:DUF6894 domain-containing protein n=2 Tax=Sphingomonas prati TaxID=1843237 RepID=A0A7W9F2X2_9SPHN|nr:hypothetical protein [Sphingomonas prati]MBB5730863.1 hypothetical protein [Sphingomonas prati]
MIEKVTVPDETGIEKSNLDDAKFAAIAAARDLIATDIIAGVPIHGSYRIEIADSTRQVIHIVRFDNVIDFRS